MHRLLRTTGAVLLLSTIAIAAGPRLDEHARLAAGGLSWQPGPPDEPVPRCTVTAENGVPLYTAPDTTAHVVSYVPRGEQLYARRLGVAGAWYQVVTHAGYEWLPRDGIDCPSPPPPITLGFPPGPAMSALPAAERPPLCIVIAQNGVHLYQAPATTAPVLGQARHGLFIFRSLLRAAGEWYQADGGGIDVWLPSDGIVCSSSP